MKCLRLLAAVAVVIPSLVACGDDTAQVNQASGRALWDDREPAAYAFTLGASGQIGVFGTRITVKDGRVVSSAPAPGLKPVPFGLKVGTIDDLFAQLDRDKKSADEVKVTYDAVWGFPSQVAVDEITNAIDDEHTYGVTDFQSQP